MFHRTLVIVALLSAAPAAHATTCVYTGAAGSYINCLAADLTTAMNDIADLRAQLDALEADAVRFQGQPITLSLGMLEYVSPNLTYTAPNGTQDSIDLTGIADGDVRFGAGGLLAVEDAVAGDAVIYVNIDDIGSHACVSLAHDNDVLRPGQYLATDTGGNVTIWGANTHTTLMLARQGDGDLPMSQFEGVAFACF